MWRIFSTTDQTFESLQLALADAVAANDVSQVPIIVEIMRFSGAPAVMDEYRQALVSLTGRGLLARPARVEHGDGVAGAPAGTSSLRPTTISIGR